MTIVLLCIYSLTLSQTLVVVVTVEPFTLVIDIVHMNPSNRACALIRSVTSHVGYKIMHACIIESRIVTNIDSACVTKNSLRLQYFSWP